VVLYDHLADVARTQCIHTPSHQTAQCVAVSTSSDARVPTTVRVDSARNSGYPKFSVWPTRTTTPLTCSTRSFAGAEAVRSIASDARGCACTVSASSNRHDFQSAAAASTAHLAAGRLARTTLVGLADSTHLKLFSVSTSTSVIR